MWGDIQYQGFEDILDKETSLGIYYCKDGWELRISGERYKLGEKNKYWLDEYLGCKCIAA